MRNYKINDEVLLARGFPSAWVTCGNSGLTEFFPLEKGMKCSIIKIYAPSSAFKVRFLVDGRIFYYAVYKDEFL